MFRVFVAALAFALSGCSFLAVERSHLPFEDPRVAEQCTGSVAPLVMGGGRGRRGGGQLVSDDGRDDRVHGRRHELR
jgi:hypothetical protein